ncbi:MAG: hypothetical protein IKE27_08415 [Oscillospiraceae bacterium]|nr:hypothetical protein [Oscillospiraceae bacterium]
MRVLKKPWFITLLVLLILVSSAFFLFNRRASADEVEESITSIKDTILARALQCYVIEGAYPESLSYLEENYGLTINKDDYKVIYTPFAENMPPEVRVIYRHA